MDISKLITFSGATWADAAVAAVAALSLFVSWRTYSLQKKLSKERLLLTVELTEQTGKVGELAVLVVNLNPVPIRVTSLGLQQKKTSEVIRPKWEDTSTTLPITLGQGESASCKFEVVESGSFHNLATAHHAVVLTASGKRMTLRNRTVKRFVKMCRLRLPIA